MQGKILIVDAIATNRIVLKVKLSSAFYEVTQAASAAEAIDSASRAAPDLIVTALTLAGTTAGELCQRLQQNPQTQHVPVLAISDRPDTATRMAALEAGVQDVLHKPVDETVLFSRVRSMIRAHNASAEWRLREDTSEALGLAESAMTFGKAGHCMLVGADCARTKHWMVQLRPLLRSKLSMARREDVLRDAEGGAVPDVFVLIQPADPNEGMASLGLISTLRANAATRHAGVLVLQTAPHGALAAQALDLGADDLMTDGFDAAELTLRVKALLRRKQMDAQLRATFRTGLKAAVHDPLTGLHNRRYAMPHLARMAEHAQKTGRAFAVMVADLDHFKQINDVFGHASGDAVLVEVARRLRAALRSADMVARIGGEEFMIVMPGTTPADASNAAIRICNDISGQPFDIPGSATPIAVTISIGMAIGDGAPVLDDVSQCAAPKEPGVILLDQADKALYSAKMRGRNRVTLGRPAA